MKIIFKNYLYESIEDESLLEYENNVFDKEKSGLVKIHPAIMKHVTDLVNEITNSPEVNSEGKNLLLDKLASYVEKLSNNRFDISQLKNISGFVELVKSNSYIQNLFFSNRSIRQSLKDLVG